MVKVVGVVEGVCVCVFRRCWWWWSKKVFVPVVERRKEEYIDRLIQKERKGERQRIEERKDEL